MQKKLPSASFISINKEKMGWVSAGKNDQYLDADASELSLDIINHWLCIFLVNLSTFVLIW